MAARVAGADSFRHARRKQVTRRYYALPPPHRVAVKPTTGRAAKQQHDLFLQTEGAMDACSEIDVIGFPLWEEEVKLMQQHFGELQAIFMHYAQPSLAAPRQQHCGRRPSGQRAHLLLP